MENFFCLPVRFIDGLAAFWGWHWLAAALFKHTVEMILLITSFLLFLHIQLEKIEDINHWKNLPDAVTLFWKQYYCGKVMFRCCAAQWVVAGQHPLYNAGSGVE